MKVTITTLDDVIFTLDVGEDLDLGSFKVFCEPESGIPVENMLLILDGRPLVNDNKSLKDLGIQDGDVLMGHYDAPQTRERSSSTDAIVGSDQENDAPDPNAVVAVVIPVPVQAEALANDDPPSSSTRAEDCLPGTSHKAKLEEELKRSSGKEKPAAEKEEPSLAHLLETSGVYDQLSVHDQHAFLQYFTENGFSEEELEYMKNFNPAFAELVLKAQGGKVSEHGELSDAEMDMALKLSIALMESANTEGGAVEAEPEQAPDYQVGEVQRPFVACQINGCDLKAFISTRCKLSVMNVQTADKIRVMDRLQEPESGRPNISGTSGMQYYGFVVVNIEMNRELMWGTFHVFEGMETEVVIGLEWLHEWQCELSFVQNMLWISLNGARVPFIEEPVLEKQKKKGRGRRSRRSEKREDDEEPGVRKERGRSRRRHSH